MNKENAKKLWKIIQEAGDYLKDSCQIIQITLKEEILMRMLRFVSKKNLMRVINLYQMKNLMK